jgi:hypothetical protein
MKYTRRRQLLHALKFHMLDKATDRVKGPGMTGFTPEQKHQMRMNKAGHKVPIHAGRSRRKTRGRRRGRGRDGTSPGPSGYGSRGTEVLQRAAQELAAQQKQVEPASAAAVGGPSPGAQTPPATPPLSFSGFLGKPRSFGVPEVLKNPFRPKAPPHQENPQDVARRNWCHANFKENPRLELMCFQQAPDDVSDTKRWSPPPPARAGRRTRRRGARASRKRPTR